MARQENLSAEEFLTRFGNTLDEDEKARLEEKAKAEKLEVAKRKLAAEEETRRFAAGGSYEARRARYLESQRPTEESKKGEKKAAAEKDVAFERFGTPDVASQKRLEAQGGVYEDPAILKLQMKNDPDALRVTLNRQAAGVDTDAPASRPIMEGVGAHGERYFTNLSRGELHEGARARGERGPTNLHPYRPGEGTLSTLGEAGETPRQELARRLLKTLEAAGPTPEAKSAAKMRDQLNAEGPAASDAMQMGVPEAQEKAKADFLAGKLPAHALNHVLTYLDSGAKSWTGEAETEGGLPPSRIDAEDFAKQQQAQAAKVKAEAEAKAQHEKELELDRLRPGGALGEWAARLSDVMSPTTPKRRPPPSIQQAPDSFEEDPEELSRFLRY
jgi:hypothetical protein